MQIVQKPDGQIVLKVLWRVVADTKLRGEEVGGQLTFLREIRTQSGLGLCLGG